MTITAKQAKQMVKDGRAEYIGTTWQGESLVGIIEIAKNDYPYFKRANYLIDELEA